MQGNVWIEDIFQEILLTIPKRYSEKQEPSSRRYHQHFSTKLHPIKKITEVLPGTCLRSSKSWRTNGSASSQLPLRTTSVLDLLQRSTATLSSSLDLSTWCNPTSSVGRHTKMLVLISNFLEICNTFTISGVPRDAILLRLFPFSLLGSAKQWFYATVDIW